MKNSGKGSQVSYNVQTAVDAEHKLIVAQDVTNAPIDRHQLASMSKRAKKALKSEELTVLAE